MRKLLQMTFILALAAVAVSCEEDEPENAVLSKTSYTLHADEQQRVEGENVSGIKWSSENDYVASMDGDMITGTYVGKTTVKSSSGKYSFTVEVKPQYNLFPEPCMIWGTTKQDMKRIFGEPDAETDAGLAYFSKNPYVFYEMYIFDDNGGLECSCVVFLRSADPNEEIFEFMHERYVLIDADEKELRNMFAHYYGKKDKPQCDYVVFEDFKVMDDIDQLLISYMPYSNKDSKVRSMDDNRIEAIKQAVSEII